jgi:hypothetical protein
LSFRGSINNHFAFDLAVGSGAYLFHSVTATTQLLTYVKELEWWKVGDVRKTVSRDHFAATTIGGEASIGFAYKLNSSLSLGVSGRLILISEIKDISEITDYYKTHWEPAEPVLITIKQGNEYSGIGWGFGASLSF